MKVINLFAEPSAGKSTTAAGLFFLLKQKGVNVELVTEYAKACVWEDKISTLNDQLYVTAKQNHALERLRGKVDVAITDSPLLLGLVYLRNSKMPSFPPMVYELFNSYDNFNVLITRAKDYNPVGRHQTEEQALAVRLKLIDLLNEYKVPYTMVLGNAHAPQTILDHLNIHGGIV